MRRDFRGIKWMFLLSLVLLLAWIDPGHTDTTPGPHIVRGDYVTGSSNPDSAELSWMSHFNIVHVGGVEDPLPYNLIEYLRTLGVQTFLLYDWFVGEYHYTDGSPDNLLMAWVYPRRDSTTLNPNGPFPHCTSQNYTFCEDYYYDMGLKSLVKRRVRFLDSLITAYNYDGVFFDWGNGLFLLENEYASMRQTWENRHPNLPYDSAGAAFIDSLYTINPSLIITNNQGFRSEKWYLSKIDLDMTESYVTDFDYFGKEIYVEGIGLVEIPQTIYYCMSDDIYNGHLDDTIYYLDVIYNLIQTYGGPHFKGMVYMNYAAPKFIPTGQIINGKPVYRPTVPRNAIYYAYAVPKLINEIIYTEVPWNHRYERCDIYFYDLGSPLGNYYETIDSGYVRYYTDGVVVVGEWQDTTELTLNSPFIPHKNLVYDAFEQTWLHSEDGTLTIHIQPQPDELTGRMALTGRLYFYSQPGVKVNVRTILEGAFCKSGDSMRTDLNTIGNISCSQPFQSAPWNYSGNEQVKRIPHGVVDWILVELRNEEDSTIVVGRRAAFVRSDGKVVDLDGFSQVNFSNIPPGNYFIALYHRNHLPIMSAHSLPLGVLTSDQFDFTSAAEQTLQIGSSPTKQLKIGVWGMVAGDANADGSVDAIDYNLVWLPSYMISSEKALPADFNLDGQVDDNDRIIWLENNGLGVRLP